MVYPNTDGRKGLDCVDEDERASTYTLQAYGEIWT